MKKLAILTLLSVAVLAGCQDDDSSSAKERRAQEQMSLQAVEAVGMPAITNFAEKRMMKDILEIRDQAVATTTYTVDMNGKFHKVCNSVGYGLPYATQYTNPQMPQRPFNGNTYVLPQADPNGLYSPASADGTWVQCVDPKSNKAKVVYIEPRVVVSPIPLGDQ